MKKRTAAIVMAIVMLFNLVCLAEDLNGTRASVKAEEQELAENVISKLEIMDYSSDNENDIISRVDFAVYLGRLLKVDEYAYSSTTYYTDIPLDHYALACINYLTETGGFDGVGGGEFHPDLPVSPIEAAKVILSVAGYRTFAEFNGGYPSGYQKLAREAKLLDGFENVDNITRGEMMVLLFRAGFLSLPDIGEFDGKYVMFKDSDDTLFARNWDLYERKDVVTAAGVVTINSSIKAQKGEIVIGDETFSDGGIGTENFLGRYVRAVTRENDDVDELVYIVTDTKYTSEIHVMAKDIQSYSDGILYYCEPGDTKEKKAKTDKAATVLYNGAIAEYQTDSLFDITKGDIYFIDVTDDGRADTVIINSYKSYIVGYADKDNGLLYGKTSGSVIADIENAESYGLFKYTGGGKLATLADIGEIAAGSIVSIRSNSNGNIDIFVSEEKISGKADSFFEDGKIKYIKIDGEDYIVDSDFLKDEGWFSNGAFMGKIGSEYTYLLDFCGEITGIESGTASTIKLAYMIKYYIDDAEDIVTVKLFTSDGQMVKYAAADKVKIDGITRKGVNEIETGLQLGDGEVIQYQLNAEGKISYIDTDFKSERETSASLKRVADKEERNAKRENASLSGDIYPTESTIKFVVPDQNKATAAEKEFSVSKGFGYSEDEDVYSAAYVFDEENIACDVLVEYRRDDYTPEFQTATLFVINRIDTQIDEDGEQVKVVEGYALGEKRTYQFTNEVMKKFENLANGTSFTSVDQFESGDVVRIAVNDKNEIFSMQLMFDYSDGFDKVPKWGPVTPEAHGGYVDAVVWAYCHRTKDGLAELKYDKTADAQMIGISNMNGHGIVTVDTSLSKNRVRIGTISDIQEYRVMKGGTKPMIVYLWRYSPRQIIIFK